MGYEVEIDWLGRRLAQLPARTRRRIRWTAEGRQARGYRKGRSEHWWTDVFDVFSGFDSGVLVALGVLAVFGVLILLWQVGVFALLLALVEIAVLIPLLLLAFVVRVVLRRPWRVVVRSGGGDVRGAADVRGYRAARTLRDTWRAALQAGTPVDALVVPSTLPATPRPDLLDPESFGEVRPDEIAG